jgi:hypothetical protein
VIELDVFADALAPPGALPSRLFLRETERGELVPIPKALHTGAQVAAVELTPGVCVVDGVPLGNLAIVQPGRTRRRPSSPPATHDHAVAEPVHHARGSCSASTRPSSRPA